MFDRLQGAWVGSGSAEEVVHTKLLREAAMQMLVFHFADGATPYRTQWQPWQASPGSYPSLLRKVAIANGSGQAAFPPDMSPGMLMLRTTFNPFNGPFAPGVVGSNYAYALGRSDHVIFTWHKPYSIYWHTKTYDPSWGNYDTAPGSSERTAGEAQDVSNHVLVAGGKTNTFMPTISTLDVQDAGSINNPNFGYNVQQQIDPRRPNRAKYAFDAYFAAGGVNEPHVEITNGSASTHPNAFNTSYYTDNSTWIQNELRESAHRLPPVLTAAYNFGNPYRHLLASVQVNAGGRLYLNNGVLPVNGGTPATQASPPPGNFDVYTANCATVVQVNSGGQVAVGTSSTYTATLLLAANSLLDLRAGSQTTVSAGSVLRIGPGATLVVRQGATLTLGGTLLIEAGAYVCLEDPASIVTTPGGRLVLNPAAFFFANPALGLTGLACLPCLTPGYITLNGGGAQPATCAVGSAVFSITTSKGVMPTYTWQVSQGTIDSGQGTDQITVSGLPFQNYSLQVSVSAPADCAGAPDISQQLTQDYYTRSPDGSFCLADPGFMATLYPNPARETVDVHLTEASVAGASASHPVTVRLFDAQGQPRAEQRSHGERVLRLRTDKLPSGLYFVHIVRGQQVLSRQQLKIAQ